KIGLDILDPEQVSQFIAAVGGSIWDSVYPPCPEIVLAYEKLSPGFFKEILKTVAAQRCHRMNLERFTTERQQRRQDVNQYSAIVLGMVGIVGALAASWFGIDRWLCAFVAGIAVGAPNGST